MGPSQHIVTPANVSGGRYGHHWRGGGPGANTLTGQIGAGYTLDYANGQKGNGAGKNFIADADPLLTNPFEYGDPDFKGMFSSPIFRAGWVAPPDDGFFDQSAKFIGGMGDEDWTEE